MVGRLLSFNTTKEASKPSFQESAKVPSMSKIMASIDSGSGILAGLDASGWSAVVVAMVLSLLLMESAVMGAEVRLAVDVQAKQVCRGAKIAAMMTIQNGVEGRDAGSEEQRCLVPMFYSAVLKLTVACGRRACLWFRYQQK